MNLYKIRNWQDLYENNRTRELKNIKWIPFPIKLSGDGYCQIMEQKNGPAIFGTFIAIVELAAQCEPRGTLIKSSGEPHSFESIGRICRIKSSIIEECINFTSQVINWIEIIVLNNNCDNSADMCDKGATVPSILVSSSLSLIGGKAGGFEKQKYSKRSVIFTPPSFDEFLEYCKENNHSGIAERAFKGYEAAGWNDSQGKPVRSWKGKLQHVWFRPENADPPKKPALKPRDGKYAELCAKNEKDMQEYRDRKENIPIWLLEPDWKKEYE